jgi:hypothetical protein
MTALFVALGIAVLTLLALLLWFVPHLLQQQALRSASESAQLREMLLDVLNEQEAVTLRQTQLSTSMTHLQSQLEQMLNAISTAQLPAVGQSQSQDLSKIEERLAALQQQLLEWDNRRMQVFRNRAEKDNESWGRLMELLSTIQDRVGELSRERSAIQVSRQANTLLEELEQEMSNLRSISEDIARLQWRLRRSLTDRNNGMASLLQSSNGTRAQWHA